MTAAAKRLKGALIGAGVVTAYHLQAWNRIPQADIVAIADPVLARAQARAIEFGIDPDRAFPSLADLLRGGGHLDFVDIATPPQTHCDLTQMAAARGLHVLCQKPFAPSLAEAHIMIEACQRSRVTLSINENWRWRSWYRSIKRMINLGEIGRPVYARIFAHTSTRLPVDGRPPANHSDIVRRSILLDWGIHHIDVLRYLFGEADTVYSRMARVSPYLVSKDRAVVTLAFGDLTGLIDLSWTSFAPWGQPNRLEHNLEDVRIEGDTGTITLVPSPEKGDLLCLTTAKGQWVQPAYDCAPVEAYQRSYVAAQRHFVECLLTGRVPETSGEDNLNTLAIALAAYHSAENNRVVSVQDTMRKP